jgi:serine/threonine protein kinase
VALRYQRQKLYSERSGVKTHEGLDPLTGLPVLIYEFAGKPDPALSDLESENIPGVLETAQEGGTGQVVVAYSKGYVSATRPLPMPSVMFVLEAAEALSDAARAGVIHGDLRPERFLVSGQHVLVEGFGIPWVSGPSSYAPPEGVANYAGDVYAFGRVMQELAPDLPVPVKTLLERCATKKPEDRPSAAQLLTALTALQRSPQDVSVTRPVPVAAPPTALPTASPATRPSQQTLEIDFTVSEPDPPAVPIIPVPKIPAPNLPAVQAGTLPDMPDLDLLEDQSTFDSQNSFDSKKVGPNSPSFNHPSSKNTVNDSFNPKGFEAKNFNTDFGAEDFDMPPAKDMSPTKRPASQDNWDDDDSGMVLETDSGQLPKTPVNPTKSSSSLPPKTSGKLPGAGPKKGSDPKQTFIKDLPPGATYKVGKSTDAPTAPFKEPAAPTFEEVFMKGNSSSKNTRRIIMVVALLVLALVLAGLAFFTRDDVGGSAAGTTATANYIVSVNLDPPNLPPLELLVVTSPEGSRFRPGAIINNRVPGQGQIVLDRAGTWQFQGRFQDKLSEVVTLRAPEQYNLVITMPDLLPPVEGAEEIPEDGEATPVEPTTPDENQ